MPEQKKNHSEELYEWLNVKFHPVDMLNADGEETSDYDEVTTFVFEYHDEHGTQENVKVSLTDDERKLDADVVSKVTVEYDQDMANQLNTDFGKFMSELKEWARGRMLGFQVTNVEAEPGKRTVQESKFSTLTGTVKTSVQTLEGVKIILKHTDIVNDDVRGARTRRIHRIYVENAQGERFLMPFTSLRGARAMARHVAQGGNPYDAVGAGISNSVTEAVSLSKFLRRTNGKQYEDVTAVSMIESARLRLAEVKKMLGGLSGIKGYSRYSTAIAEQNEIEYNPEVKNHFVRNQYDEQLDHSLPYVWRAYQMSNLKEFDEFAQWTDSVVNEVDAPANPKVQAVQKLLGQEPEKPNEPKANVQLTPQGTVDIELDSDDKAGAAQVAKAIPQFPKGTSVTVKEGQMQQFEVTFEKNGKTVTKTISAVSQGSAEIQAYHMADATDSAVVGDVKPVSEGLGGDRADDLINDVKQPGQEMYERNSKITTPLTYDDADLAQQIIDRVERGESLEDLQDQYPMLQQMKDDIAVDYHYHLDDDYIEIENQLLDNLKDIVKHSHRAKTSGQEMNEDDVEEGNEFTGARQAAIKAGKKHFKVGDKTYSVTGDTSDEEQMSESLDRILYLSGVRK